MVRTWRPTTPDEWESPEGMRFIVKVIPWILKEEEKRHPGNSRTHELYIYDALVDMFDEDCNLATVLVCLEANPDIFWRRGRYHWDLQIGLELGTIVPFTPGTQPTRYPKARRWFPTSADEWVTPEGMRWIVMVLTQMLWYNAHRHPECLLGGTRNIDIHEAFETRFVDDCNFAAVLECLDANPDRFRRTRPNHWALAGVGPPIGPPLVT